MGNSLTFHLENACIIFLSTYPFTKHLFYGMQVALSSHGGRFFIRL